MSEINSISKTIFENELRKRSIENVTVAIPKAHNSDNIKRFFAKEPLVVQPLWNSCDKKQTEGRQFRKSTFEK